MSTNTPEPQIGRVAARGAVWMIATSIGARVIGLLGTLIVTRFLAPDVMGDIAAAMIVSLTTGCLVTWGFGQYAVVEGRGADALEVTWHATVAYTVVGLVGFGGVTALAPVLADALGAPGAARYIPGFALAAIIRRVGATPERVLTRSLRFRSVAVASAAGEVAYGIVATSLVASGWGGQGVIVGNIVQSSVASALLIRAAGWREWATPVRLRWQRFARMLRFGVPLAVQSTAHAASRYWGTLLITRLFGSAATGLYSLAYNFADIPAIYIGEQLALVLMPSMANLPPERRAPALERSTRLLALILFPLAIGLGLVAEPLIAIVLPAKWQGVAPLLVVLSALSVFRPITWTLSAYLEARAQTGRLMLLEVASLIVMLCGIWLLSPLGIVWSAAAVGMAFGLYAIAGVLVVSRSGLSIARLAIGFVQPLVACGAMALVVLMLRPILQATVRLPAQLAVEILVGAFVYVNAALVVCRATARDLIGVVREMIWSRTGRYERRE
ncbi:MAG TPA: oligosaccharide flippase family protein [Kofleriaceae bacterium]|nr:oligosaccharide flippase family protein [Kofleriaceae bacterium]